MTRSSSRWSTQGAASSRTICRMSSIDTGRAIAYRARGADSVSRLSAVSSKRTAVTSKSRARLVKARRSGSPCLCTKRLRLTANTMERAIPVLPANDLPVAREFYVDKLGFDVRFEVVDETGAGLLGVQRGGIWLTLDCPMTGHGRDACVSLQVDDADVYYE